MQLKTIWANSINDGTDVVLDNNDVLWIKDNIIEAIPPYSRGLYDFFQQAGTPAAVISELCVDTDAGLSPVPIYSVPFRSMCILPINFSQEPVPEHPVTDYCFSFAVNKKQAHRHLLLKLIEFYQLRSYDGTYSAAWRDFDMSRILLELDSCDLGDEFRDKIIQPIALEKRWIEWPTLDHELDHRRGTKDMLWTWQSGLGEICQRSAVHLIAETVQFEQSSMFGEKTLHAVMAMNFPIWIGGYANAAAFERLGFDAFSDIIDHSYQYLPTLVQRCQAAFELNLPLLTDLELVARLRRQCVSRLKQNHIKLYDGTVQNYIWQTVNSWPSPINHLVSSAMQQELTAAQKAWKDFGFVGV